ncbi:MAG: hypothetical protein KAQ67_06470, partial [Gammaproteobacteria bacterium]|nr:hypothetical protein [Gammaproteobacteria bacterium]
DGSDSVGFSTLQTSFPVADNQEFPRIKLRLSRAEDATFEQEISSGLIVVFAGETFSGPANITGNFNLSINAFAYGAEQAINKNTHLGWYLGLAHVNLDLLISSFSQSAMSSESSSNPYFEIFVYKNYSPKFTGRASLVAAVSSSNSLIELDLGLGYQLLRNMEVMAGLRTWSYQYSRGEYQSEITLSLSGPYLSLNLSF